jgi:AbrB family looped-hinge helix DNA binding protein
MLKATPHRDGMKKETRLRVSKNGEVRIPAVFRKAMGIRAGDEVVLRLESGDLRISNLEARLARAQRLVRKHVKAGESLSGELIAEQRGASSHRNIEEHGKKE